MTETLEQRIKRHEGLTLIPKPDAKGMYVIGYGHDIPESEASNYPDGCTLEDAMNWLDADIEKATEQVNNALPWVYTLSELRHNVLIEMCFQIGINGLLGFHNTLAAIERGDYADAAARMKASEWHTETPGRCDELAAIMLNNSAA